MLPVSHTHENILLFLKMRDSYKSAMDTCVFSHIAFVDEITYSVCILPPLPPIHSIWICPFVLTFEPYLPCQVLDDASHVGRREARVVEIDEGAMLATARVARVPPGGGDVVHLEAERLLAPGVEKGRRTLYQRARAARLHRPPAVRAHSLMNYNRKKMYCDISDRVLQVHSKKGIRFTLADRGGEGSWGTFWGTL